jgi:hypothetical protein
VLLKRLTFVIIEINSPEINEVKSVFYGALLVRGLPKIPIRRPALAPCDAVGSVSKKQNGAAIVEPEPPRLIFGTDGIFDYVGAVRKSSSNCREVPEGLVLGSFGIPSPGHRAEEDSIFSPAFFNLLLV